MTRRLTSLLLLTALLVPALASGECAAAPWPPRAGLYSPAAQSPFSLRLAPTAMATVDAAGDGYDDLVIGGSAAAGRVQLLEMRNGRIDGVRTRTAEIAPTAMASAPGSDEVLVAGAGEARIFDFQQFEYRRARIVPTEGVAVGREPAAVLAKLVFVASTGPGGETSETGSADFAIADRAADEILLVDRDWRADPFAGGTGRLEAIATVPVGDAPVAMAGLPGAPGYFYVANSGSGTLTQLPNTVYDGVMRAETIPVGGEPVAIALGDFVWGDYNDPEIVVADRERDEVELLDSRRDPAGGPSPPYEVIARYRVGDAPVDLQAEQLDEQPGKDIAVVNSLSDNVSVLLGTGSGFVGGGTYPVGHHPVAIVPTGYGRYFDHDLAIANRGSRDVTLLVRNEFGHCQGHPARLRIGTAERDRLGGEQGRNETDGRGGDDRIWAGYGDDCLRGGDGRDVLRGGDGDDLLRPGPGRDAVYGESGNDTIDSRGGGNDIVDCGKGADVAYAGPEDLLRGCERTPGAAGPS